MLFSHIYVEGALNIQIARLNETPFFLLLRCPTEPQHNTPPPPKDDEEEGSGGGGAEFGWQSLK